MPAMFRVTYEIVTPESAENGEAEESGFVLPGNWRDPIDYALTQSRNAYNVTLRDAMRLASPQEDCGHWWSECDGRQDYQTGAIETRSIHPPHDITAASYRRVSRLLGFK